MAARDRQSLSTNVDRYRNIDKPRYSKPAEIGVLCLNDDGQFLDNGSSLKYYHSRASDEVKKQNFNLNIGYEEFAKNEEHPETYQLSIENLLKWISAHKEELIDEDSERLKSEFVCWRGLLTRLLTTVYEQRQDWIVAVTLYNGTYYMCEYETDERHKERLNPDPRQHLMSYWGRKFEHFCVTDRPGGLVKDPREVEVTKEQFCSIVSTKLEEHRLLFGGEVDCCDPVDHKRYMELKTNRIFSNSRQEQNFGRFKALRLWAQSFLIGISEIVVGFRDDDGRVSYLKSYQTREMPRLGQGWWEPGTCFTFTHRLLKFIKNLNLVDDPHKTSGSGVFLRLSYINRAVCVLRYGSAESRVTSEFHAGPSSWTFIPDWYVQHWTKKCSNDDQNSADAEDEASCNQESLSPSK